MRVIVTGCAGFIGFHLANRLLANGIEVFGVDDLDAYYDPMLKQRRLDQLTAQHGFNFQKGDLADKNIYEIWPSVDRIFHLAAQAGVRYSMEHPERYIHSNINGTFRVLEWCRHHPCEHLLFASSSSVYGDNNVSPFKEDSRTDKPVSFYAATKASTELLARSYAKLYGIQTTGMRFFTAYGPWGRPDMALFKFTKAVLEGKPLDVYGEGTLKRDFTYVTDIVEAVVRLADLPPDGSIPFRAINIGNNRPFTVNELITAVELACGKIALKNFMPVQPGDVTQTHADISLLQSLTAFTPATSLAQGVGEFVAWYKTYFGVN
jgi:UDP-glucuronate 4-epimerase